MAIAASAGLAYSDLFVCDFLWLNAKLNALSTERKFFWTLARFVAFFAVKPYDTKNKLRYFSDLIEFDWEKERHVLKQRFTEEEIKAFHEASLRLFEKLAEKEDASSLNA